MITYGSASKCLRISILRSIEFAVDWVAEFIEWARNHNVRYTFVEPSQEKMDAWYKHVEKLDEGLLSNQVDDSWYSRRGLTRIMRENRRGV